MYVLFTAWMIASVVFQVLFNWISRKINYGYGKKMEYMAIGLNMLVWGIFYAKWVSPTIKEGFQPMQLLFIIVCTVLISIIFIDLKYYEIPNSYNAFIALAGVFYITQTGDSWLNFLLGGIIAFVLFFLIAIFTGGNLGMGDVKLVLGLGFLLGKALLFPFFIVTFLSGALISIALLVFKLKTSKDRIAFGPYICFGFIWLLLA